MKVELNSLQCVTMDSTRLLTEKLTLARELSALKPEVDHLRSQAVSHQSLLAEKLVLQRRLSTMQVELETERRSKERAVAKEHQLQAGDAKLESQIETLQAEVANERRGRQKIEYGIQKTSTESENRTKTLESRVDAFRNKLRTTKEQLKNTQAALEAAQTNANAPSNRSTTSLKPIVPLSKNSRKRGASQMDADSMIGTPGDVPAAKKNSRPSALVGEKSTFSITPFLNRTVTGAPEIPPLESAGACEAELANHVSAVGDMTRVAGETGPIPRKFNLTKGAVRAKNEKVLENAKSTETNFGPPPGRKHTNRPTPKLDKVAEEEDTGNDGVAVPIPKAASIRAFSDEAVNDEAQLKKTRRKILGSGLGKTLFDEDNEDTVKGDGGLLIRAKGFGIPNGRGLGRLNSEPRKAFTLSASVGTFGAISPRKGR